MRDLRNAGIESDMDLTGRAMKAQFKLADRAAAAVSIIVGETELAAGTAVVKNMKTQEQTSLPSAKIVDRLRAMLEIPTR